jgi:hypothetical protein
LGDCSKAAAKPALFCDPLNGSRNDSINAVPSTATPDVMEFTRRSYVTLSVEEQERADGNSAHTSQRRQMQLAKAVSRFASRVAVQDAHDAAGQQIELKRGLAGAATMSYSRRPGGRNDGQLLLVFKVDGESKARSLRLSAQDGWLIASRIRPRHFDGPRIHPRVA